MSSPADFKEVMKDLLVHGSYSDMEITCQGFTFKVHRNVVCTQSHFFKSALSGDFKEATERAISLPDDGVETIERVLSYLYLQDYHESGHIVPLKSNENKSHKISEIDAETAENDPNSDAEDGSANSETIAVVASNNVLVYIAADKFGIIPLKSLAAERFTRWVDANWESGPFLGIVEEVMTLVPPHDSVIRNILADAISKNLRRLVSQGAILPLIETFGSLGSAVIARLVETDRVMGRKEEQFTILTEIAQKFDLICKHCGRTFNAGMEIGEYQYGRIQCAVCRW
ncbi:hypothetical protein FQN49_007277 [Arthroderma sp. PD_2]|nr:hypothetical protein FQN49_007277 [Arthroderma sp. PD_2]